MKILHISAECYPAAKAGGLGDVVGALPKYLNQRGVQAAVVIPKYATKWIRNEHWQVVFEGEVRMHTQYFRFSVQAHQPTDGKGLGYPFYTLNIPGLYDREGVYIDGYTGFGYRDETERSLCFQQAVLHWVKSMDSRPDVLHCHDHHTGLIPFMVKHAYDFRELAHIPTVFTIHNGEYQGAFRWNKMQFLPFFDIKAKGLLDWGNVINSMASAIRCAWKVTTVSGGYLEELQQKSGNLTWLLNQERPKSHGILNGIDTNVWNPKTDKFIAKRLDRSIETFKAANKKEVLKHFHVSSDRPLITFIGRLVGEKGAQLLPAVISNFLNAGGNANFAVLGTGDPNLHQIFQQMRYQYPGRFDAKLEYNEGLAHQLYAGSDFLIMPSKVEPCGLNQMYALRYGTIPIVRAIGGLKDTITDIGDANGTGIRFHQFSTHDTFTAVRRAAMLYNNKAQFETIRARIMAVDFSWERSAEVYKALYGQLV